MPNTDLDKIMEKLNSLDLIQQDVKEIHTYISKLSQDVKTLESQMDIIGNNVKTLEYQMDIVGNQSNDGFINSGFRKAFSKAAVIGASRQVNPSYMR